MERFLNFWKHPFWKHPLIIAVVGAILGSVFIPWIAGRSKTKAALADARVNKAIEIMVSSNSVNVTANKLKTAFEEFEDHVLSASGAVYERRCDELRKTVLELYSEFDGAAWWWPWSIYYQGRMLGLIPTDRQDDFEAHIAAYIKNVTTTAELLDRPMDAYMTGNPNPEAKVPIMATLKQRLEALQKERDVLAQQMGAEFRWHGNRKEEQDTARKQ